MIAPGASEAACPLPLGTQASGGSSSSSEAAEASFHSLGIEVDQQAELEARQLEVGQQLRFVHRGEVLDRLDFEDQNPRDDEVQPVAIPELNALVCDWDRSLTFEGNIP